MWPDGPTWTNSSKYQIQDIEKEIIDIYVSKRRKSSAWLYTRQEKMEE